MRLDPNLTADEIEQQLRVQAELSYGKERASELGPQIEGLAKRLATLGSRELEPSDVPPDLTGISEWSGE